jgi:hypothetical protein
VVEFNEQNIDIYIRRGRGRRRRRSRVRLKLIRRKVIVFQTLHN